MTTDPDEQTRHVPVTEVITNPAAAPPARDRSDSLQEHEHTLPVPLVPLPFSGKRSRFLRLIGFIAALAIVGVGTWYWWPRVGEDMCDG